MPLTIICQADNQLSTVPYQHILYNPTICAKLYNWWYCQWVTIILMPSTIARQTDTQWSNAPYWCILHNLTISTNLYNCWHC